ncbi:hypothetical protein B0A49_07093 [Cryomyces minteri]|uniref:NmrA-like domain-containing protein n=1 Tax=Cryomyces minteri TaxID=331657 RepID=A0A4V5NFW1_9PEZI|nr:hypothetical protein B0A49_07093 [Cryomyces minteri]
MDDVHILIVGATGYIGGSVLSKLLSSQENAVRKCEVSALVREEERAEAMAKLGVTPIIFRDLDDVGHLRRVVSEHDVVIDMAPGYHAVASKALIAGLGDRKKRTGKEVFYIQTDGHPTLATARSLAHTPNREVYAQRTTVIGVVEAGLASGVKTYVIMSPTSYGLGSGIYNQLSIQIPILIRAALKAGRAEVIGEGK